MISQSGNRDVYPWTPKPSFGMQAINCKESSLQDLHEAQKLLESLQKMHHVKMKTKKTKYVLKKVICGEQGSVLLHQELLKVYTAFRRLVKNRTS